MIKLALWPDTRVTLALELINRQGAEGPEKTSCALLLLKFLMVIAEGRMPPLDKVLAAVEQTRKKYRQRILDGRKPSR